MGQFTDPELVGGAALMMVGATTLILTAVGVQIPLLALAFATMLLAAGTLLVGLDLGLFADER